MRHHRDQRRHPQIGGLTGHIGPRDNGDTASVFVAESEVVRRKGIFAERHLDDGMARVFNDKILAHIHLRTAVPLLGSDGAKREQRVELGDKVRCALYRRRLRQHRLYETGVYPLLDRQHFALGAEHFALKGLELVCDKAFGVHKRLLAYIVHGRASGVALGNFYVISEDLVDPGLQILYSAPGPLGLLKGGEPRRGILRFAAPRIELRVKAALDHAAVAQEARHGIGDRRHQQRREIRGVTVRNKRGERLVFGG